MRNQGDATITNRNGSMENQKLCQSQSGGALSVLAAFCAISEAFPALRCVHEIFEPIPATDDESRLRLQQMATCFCCELTRLAKQTKN